MIKTLFLFTSLFSVQFLSAQAPKWDSTFRPNGYQLKVDQFRSYNDKSAIIFLGNSITAGTDWSELLQLNNVRNRGISGDITFGALERLEEVTSGKPKKVFILIGINDISRNIPDSQILKNYRRIIKIIKDNSPSTKIYFHTLLPVNNTFPAKNQFNKDEHILAVNTGLKNMVKEYGIYLIDLYPHFLNAENKLDKKYTEDGLHLNADGYKVWASILKKEWLFKMTRMINKFLCSCIIVCFAGCSPAKKNMTTELPQFDKQGHRGSRGLMPENTIPAMYKAIDFGVTTLEMDVVISKDKKVVVSHDPYFNADITTTPEGKILSKAEGAQRLLYAMNYDSIKKYDVGIKPHPGYPRQQKMAVNKPLLEELIRSSEAYAKQKNLFPLWYNIETKSKPGFDGVHHPAPAEFVDLLVAVIQKEGVAGRTVIQSFDMRTLQAVHQKYPSIKTSLLMENTDKRTLDEQLKELGFVPVVYSPHYSMVTPALIKSCHDKGMKIIPWTVNTKQEIERIKLLGVDGIITDYPDLFQ